MNSGLGRGLVWSGQVCWLGGEGSPGAREMGLSLGTLGRDVLDLQMRLRGEDGKRDGMDSAALARPGAGVVSDDEARAYSEI